MENIDTNEGFENSRELLERISILRNSATNSNLNLWLDSVFDFDKELKHDMKERFGDTALLQEVDVWQKLIGGTVEEKRGITPEQYNYVFKRIEAFISEMEPKIL